VFDIGCPVNFFFLVPVLFPASNSRRMPGPRPGSTIRSAYGRR
jgi:hypothetical protein